MIQRNIGLFLANKIKDEIFAPQAVENEEGEIEYIEPEHDPLDGELIRDNEGRALGRAYRVPDVAVYVVSGNNIDPDQELDRALNDPEAETIIHWEGDRITALVYIPEQARTNAATGVHGLRADDI